MDATMKKNLTESVWRRIIENCAVANDVETEQIVWDVGSTPNFNTGKFTSYVQRRGSVPLFWSQDKPANRAVVVKPPIFVDLVEPHALTTAAHFRELRRKYGHPVVVMNLVKRREKRHNENVLHEQFLKTVKYLNQFRKPRKCIDYVSFDVSRCHKSSDVLQKLEILGFRALMAHGWFQSFPQLRSREIKKHWLLDTYQPIYSSDGTLILQHGISRTNCVDCLDRTNVAQFGIGKVALGLQLHAMGYIEEPVIDLNTEICRVLEELYDEHGDTLAWQYAGSQLVHSIKTYKKTSAFQERSRDVFQTISRYYSNNFSDYEKQDGINLFLGIFRPMSTHSRLASDRYLHFPPNLHRVNEFLSFAVNISSDNEYEEEDTNHKSCLKEWVARKAEEGNIILSNNFVPQVSCFKKSQKGSVDKESVDSVSTSSQSDALEDIFCVVNRTFELTSFDQLLKEAKACKVVTLDGLNQSLFQTTSFMKMFKSPEPTKKYPSPPPLLGHPQELAASATISAKSASSNEEDDEDDDDDDEPVAGISREDEHIQINEDKNSAASKSLAEPYKQFSSNSQGITNKPGCIGRKTMEVLSLQSDLKASSQVYAFEYQEPSEQDMAKYRRYACMAVQPDATAANNQASRKTTQSTLDSLCQLGPMFEFTPSFFTVDSAFHTEINKVSDKSLEVYRKACLTNLTALEPSASVKKIYVEHAV